MRQRQSFGQEIVVDLAVGCRVPQHRVLNGSCVFSCLVVAEKVADLVDENRGIFFDGVGRQPFFVVVQTPASVHGHACDLIGFDRNEIE